MSKYIKSLGRTEYLKINTRLFPLNRINSIEYNKKNGDIEIHYGDKWALYISISKKEEIYDELKCMFDLDEKLEKPHD